MKKTYLEKIVEMEKIKIDSKIKYLCTLTIEELRKKYLECEVHYTDILVLKQKKYISNQEELYITEFRKPKKELG